MADILENPVDLIDDAYEQEIQVEQEPIEVVAYRSYNQLDDKPQINGVELVGNKTSSDLGITAQINSAVNSEAQTRQQADSALQGEIDAEELARQQADSTLQGKIDAEETARKAADKDIQDVLDGETLARQNADTALGGRIDTEIHDRQVADIGLQGQIDAITSKSDVVDVVATYAALQAYDTQHLGDNDVIKVLDDETHGDALTYYRWSKTNQTWSYIGQEAPYYSKSQTDTLLLSKQDKIDSTHKLSADLVDDTNTTNKFVTAADKTNWNAKQDALTAGQNINIMNGVVSTPAIAPEVVAELPATGTEGKLYLTPKNYTTGTASGNPITISLGEDAGQITSAQLDGDTYQQSYTGKNKLYIPNITNTSSGVDIEVSDGNISCSGTVSASWGFNIASGANQASFSEALPAGTYTASLNKAVSVPIKVVFVDSSSQTIGTATINAGELSASYTTNREATKATAWSNVAQNTQVSFNGLQIMVESGSSATTFEPYVGGVPSPSPSYPQNINVVTGTQTVSVNGTNYTVNLGDIELCKLGDYQDYIYKDGDDWKVHKAIGGLFADENTPLERGNFGTNSFMIVAEDALRYGVDDISTVIAKPFYPIPYNDRTLEIPNSVFIANKSGGINVIYIRNTQWASTNELSTWLSSNPTKFRYILATPTDTTITDTNLIAQLEAVRTASLQASNTIINTATGTNLAGDLELGYYEYDAQNRYDKWLWLDLNNNYEKLGS